MKTKYLLLGICVLLVVAGVAGGRVAWRIHHQLVTLNVRNAPLPVVLHQLERQTWTRIRAEQALDSVRISLRVTDKPLSKVLDRIAEQAGAHWSSIYAVYASGYGLQALDSALRHDGKIESAGWKKLAPEAPVLPPPGTGPEAMPPGPEPDRAAGPPPPGQRRMMMIAVGGKSGPVTFFGGAGAAAEMWSPEELVAETAVSARLSKEEKPEATAAAAASLARKLNAKWTTYVGFRKSGFGPGFAMPHDPPGPGQRLRGPNPDERFAKLTPEQRVERLRLRLGVTTNINEQARP